MLCGEYAKRWSMNSQYNNDFGLYIGVSARGCIWPSLRHLVTFSSKIHFLFEEYFSWFVNSGVMAVKWLIAFRLFLSKSVTLLRFSWLLFMMFLLGWIGCWFDRLVKLILTPTKNLNNVFFLQVVYTYKDGSPDKMPEMFKHAIIPRREWWLLMIHDDGRVLYTS